MLITEGPCEERLVVRVDSIDALAIRCDAFGIPPPTVTWTLNGDTVLVRRWVWFGNQFQGVFSSFYINRKRQVRMRYIMAVALSFCFV